MLVSRIQENGSNLSNWKLHFIVKRRLMAERSVRGGYIGVTKGERERNSTISIRSIGNGEEAKGDGVGEERGDEPGVHKSR